MKAEISPLSSLTKVWHRVQTSLLPRALTIAALTLAPLVPSHACATMEGQPNTPKEIAVTLAKAVGWRLTGLPFHAPYDVQLACLPFRVNEGTMLFMAYMQEQLMARHPYQILGHRQASVTDVNLFDVLDADTSIARSINHSIHEATFFQTHDAFKKHLALKNQPPDIQKAIDHANAFISLASQTEGLMSKAFILKLYLDSSFAFDNEKDAKSQSISAQKWVNDPIDTVLSGKGICHDFSSLTRMMAEMSGFPRDKMAMISLENTEHIRHSVFGLRHRYEAQDIDDYIVIDRSSYRFFPSSIEQANIPSSLSWLYLREGFVPEISIVDIANVDGLRTAYDKEGPTKKVLELAYKVKEQDLSFVEQAYTLAKHIFEERMALPVAKQMAAELYPEKANWDALITPKPHALSYVTDRHYCLE